MFKILSKSDVKKNCLIKKEYYERISESKELFSTLIDEIENKNIDIAITKEHVNNLYLSLLSLFNYSSYVKRNSFFQNYKKDFMKIIKFKNYFGIDKEQLLKELKDSLLLYNKVFNT